MSIFLIMDLKEGLLFISPNRPVMSITGWNWVDHILSEGHSCPKMLGWIWTCYAPDLFALSLPPPLQPCTLQWMTDVFQKANFWHKASMPQEAAFKVMGPGCCWPDSALQTEGDREERWELILKLMIALFQRRDLTWLIFLHMKIAKNLWELEALDWSFAKSVGCMPFGGVKKRKSQMGSPFVIS